VLTVGIDLHHRAIAVLGGIPESHAHRAAHAQVERKRGDESTGRARGIACTVRGTVVDH